MTRPTSSFAATGRFRPDPGLFAAAALGALVFAAGPAGDAYAEVLIATDHIRPGVVIEAEHVRIASGRARPGELEALEEAIGLAARSTIYKGRPIRADQVGPPIVVRRNTFVAVEFRRGALSLRTEGRALDEGGVGDRIRVMNVDSKRTIIGVIVAPGQVEVR